MNQSIDQSITERPLDGGMLDCLNNQSTDELIIADNAETSKFESSPDLPYYENIFNKDSAIEF